MNDIKNELKSIQKNFNPQKATYKIIDEVINGSFSFVEVFKKLSRIKGTEKYPLELKDKYLKIMSSLQENIMYKKKIEENPKKKENTEEIKNLIDNLEKSDTSFRVVAKGSNDKTSSEIDLANIASVSSVDINDSSEDDDLKNKGLAHESETEKTIFDILKFLVIGSFVVMILIFLFL